MTDVDASPLRRLRRAGIVGGLVAGLAGCAGGAAHQSTGTTTSTSPPTTVAPSTTTTTTPALPVGTLGVGTRTDLYVDASRPTPPNGGAPGAPNRTMPTTVWYPAAIPAGAPGQNAPPDLTHGPYPLVVFAHGFNVTPATYAALLARWASAGYVVVAPTLPLLNADAPGGAREVVTQYAANITDVDFALGEALRRAATPGDPLVGLIDPDQVALAGHSDGELLAYALGLLPCCHDPQVKAIIPMAGNLANADTLPTATGVPVLHIMEDHDEYDSYSASIAFDRQTLPAPKDLLTLVSANHTPPYTQPGDPHFDLVSRATVDFLDATLKHRVDGLAALQALVSAAPTLASLEATPAPPATTPTS